VSRNPVRSLMRGLVPIALLLLTILFGATVNQTQAQDSRKPQVM